MQIILCKGFRLWPRLLSTQPESLCLLSSLVVQRPLYGTQNTPKGGDGISMGGYTCLSTVNCQNSWSNFGATIVGLAKKHSFRVCPWQRMGNTRTNFLANPILWVTSQPVVCYEVLSAPSPLSCLFLCLPALSVLKAGLSPPLPSWDASWVTTDSSSWELKTGTEKGHGRCAPMGQEVEGLKWSGSLEDLKLARVAIYTWSP